jgi:YHS domain-containing protein
VSPVLISYSSELKEKTVLRFVILAVLIFLAYRLLVDGLKRGRDTEKRQMSASTDAAVNDVLVEDPVCHSLVPRQQAIRLQHKGTIVYFCSENCCNIFIKQGEEK